MKSGIRADESGCTALDDALACITALDDMRCGTLFCCQIQHVLINQLQNLGRFQGWMSLRFFFYQALCLLLITIADVNDELLLPLLLRLPDRTGRGVFGEEIYETA